MKQSATGFMLKMENRHQIFKLESIGAGRVLTSSSSRSLFSYFTIHVNQDRRIIARVYAQLPFPKTIRHFSHTLPLITGRQSPVLLLRVCVALFEVTAR